MCRLNIAVTLGVCLFLPAGVFGTLIEDNGYIGPGDPGYVGYLPSLDTWWHDGGPPLGPTTPDDSVDVFPDKNHDVGQFTETVARPSLVNSYARKLGPDELVSMLPTVAWGDIFGDYWMGEYLDLTGATDHYFPPGTAGKPLHFVGDNQASGVRFYDVKDEMLVQFFSSDKNDGWIEIVLNGTVIMRYDTWCEGWWYFRLYDLDPNVADNVELRTWWDDVNDNGSIPSIHINTLDLNPNSENWAHLLPTDEGYPWPDDFHIFYIAYNPVQIPEPTTMTLVAVGLGGAVYWKRRKGRRHRTT